MTKESAGGAGCVTALIGLVMVPLAFLVEAKGDAGLSLFLGFFGFLLIVLGFGIRATGGSLPAQADVTAKQERIRKDLEAKEKAEREREEREQRQREWAAGEPARQAAAERERREKIRQEEERLERQRQALEAARNAPPEQW